MNETPDRAESVFAAAVAVKAEERAAYLDQACADDPSLRDHVEALLRAHDRAGHLLDEPVPGGPVPDSLQPTVDHVPSEQPGTIIAGRYKLLEQIGEGGMGTVWVAEQTQPVRRRVALKLIKAGMDSKSVLARFEAERQALAVMDHPNIAKVLDGGLTETGRPFFAMEYVKGVPITEYCDATRLSVPERLQLFVQVCQAVQHAHQKGIIHRDLKPSNILVAPYDDRPVPKIIDFGLAKAMHQSLTELTLHTAHEMVLGTPLYMSPEQAQLNNLDVDTRSDLYSLGVLLYELLTGSTPLEKQRFKEAAWDEVRRIIREEEPPRPSMRLSSSQALPSLAAGRQTEPARLTKLVRGDLDWIAMKALEKNRNRRYETANGFAMDIQRYLAGEPVLAAPPSAGYRLRKFARRHRAALTMAATILLLLITGAAVSTWQAVRATRAEAAARAAEQDALQAQRAETERAEGERLAKQDAEARRADAERQKTRAEEGFRLAHGAVDRYLAKVGSSPRLEQAGLQTLRKDLLEDAGAFYEQLIRLKSNDPAMKAELAAAFLAFANVARWNGSTQPAIERTKRALTLFEELAASNAGNETYQSNVVAAAVGLGALLSEQGSVTQAEACYKKALDIQTRLTAARPDDETRQAELASVYYGYALLCNQTARLEEAIALGERARQVYARLAAVHPGDNMEGLFKNHEAGALINLGLMYANAKRYAEAEQALDRALLLFRELSQGNPTSTWMRSGVARSLVNLGTLYMTTARPEKAETVFNQVLAIYQELAREDPEMTRWQESLAMSWGSLYSLYVSTRRPDKAQEAAEQICAVWKKLRDAYPLEARYRLQLAQASLAYGLLLQSRSRSEEAVPLYGEAIRAMQALSQKPQGQAQATVLLCAAHAMRATALNELGRFAEALEDWTRASELGKGKLTSKGRIGRAISWAGIKDHAKAVSEAKQLLAEPSMSALDVYNIGCICAIASTVAKQDARLSEAERSRLAGTYADMAMETLRRAVKEGWSDAGHIKKDKDLDSLRERADFQQLVADLEKKK